MFLKQAFAAASVAFAAAPIVNAAVNEAEVPVDFGKNPASWSGGGKEKSGQVKTGNAGSIMKK